MTTEVGSGLGSFNEMFLCLKMKMWNSWDTDKELKSAFNVGLLYESQTKLKPHLREIRSKQPCRVEESSTMSEIKPLQCNKLINTVC